MKMYFIGIFFTFQITTNATRLKNKIENGMKKSKTSDDTREVFSFNNGGPFKA